MITNPDFPAPGTEVSCSYRWPYQSAHPDCWQPPHKGVVLALDDPRAWTNSIAFPGKTPTQEECTAHVQWCVNNDLLKTAVPVLWTPTTPGEQWIGWDYNLRPYEQELERWRQARAEAYEKYKKVDHRVDDGVFHGA